MHIGVFAKTFAGNTPRQVLQAVKNAGFEAAQYNMACSGLASLPDEITPQVIEDIRNAASETGIRIPALSATYNMIHPSTDERGKGHRRLDVMMRAANALGVPTVTLCTGTRDARDQWRHHADNASTSAWRDLRQSMEHAVTLADRHDIFLGIEPELANVVNSAAKARQLIDEMQSPRIKIVLDPANLFEVEAPEEQRRIISASIDLLGDHIIMAHAKDRSAAGAFMAAGQGVLDYTHFLGELRRVGFAGPLITHGLTEAEAPAVAQFLKQKLAA
jgi:sugar phosphate isomerase/epimerase